MIKYFLFLLSVVFLFLLSSLFIIQEGERGIILQFGTILRDSQDKTIVYKPGFHFKWPLLDTVKILDARIHTVDNKLHHFITKDKKEIIIQSYAQWRINDFDRYYSKTIDKSISQIELLLKNSINHQLQININHLNMKDIISDTNHKLTHCILNQINNKILNSNHFKLNNANEIFELGIQILDIRISKINLPKITYNKMSDPAQLNNKIISKNQYSEGYKESERLRSCVDYKMSIFLKNIKKKALIMKNNAQAQVDQLLLNNFNKESNYYHFISKLRVYEKNFKNNNPILLINSKYDFLQYMKQMKIL